MCIVDLRIIFNFATMKSILLYIVFLPFVFVLKQCSTPVAMTTQNHAHTNALVNETSPYLLQHAHNPVNWYPWGEEALKKAEEEDKSVIISIGYAACHWCHVMEHESFEDEEVAALMNDNFVCIKVDREERPDIDDVYMTACHLMTGRGGWPLNAIALPDGKPFFAGTYFPKDEWVKLLNQIIELKKNDNGKLIESANQISKGIQEADYLEVITSDVDFSITTLNQIAERFKKRIDFKNGGRKGSPKFPMPNNYEFLLKHGTKYNDGSSIEAVETTLDKMAAGGIYDQLGGGFARYSVDGIWLAPHFEKMLYDNGQLLSLYSQAYQRNKKPAYKKVIEETIAFIERELMSDEYGFYASLDADSEGEEGKFYVFAKSEVDSIINDALDAKYFCAYYDITTHGNWEHTNILRTPQPLEKVAEQMGIDSEAFSESIERSKAVLFNYRSKRIRPGLDDKILTSWNALMLKGLVDAYNALGNDAYLTLALKNANFIKTKLKKPDNRLDRNYKNGTSNINGFLDDYALLIYGYHALYEATLNEEWLTEAKDLLDYTILHFYNTETTMFDYTSDLDPPLVAKKMENNDNVIPGSNSMMARNLFRVGSMYYNTEWLSMSKQMLKNLNEQLTTSSSPDFYSNWLQLYYDNVNAPYEIAIVGPSAKAVRSEMAKEYLGNAMFLGGSTEGSLPLLTNKQQEGETTIYVCQNKVCKLPVRTAEEALKLLD